MLFKPGLRNKCQTLEGYKLKCYLYVLQNIRNVQRHSGFLPLIWTHVERNCVSMALKINQVIDITKSHMKRIITDDGKIE